MSARRQTFSDAVPAVSAEALYQFRFTRRECDRIAWALEQRAGTTLNDEVRETLLAVARRLRAALEGQP